MSGYWCATCSNNTDGCDDSACVCLCMEQKIALWSWASDHLHRAGRQISALRAGGYVDQADSIHESARRFIDTYPGGREDRRSLAAVYQMAKMEDAKRSLWMGAWR